MLTRCNDVDPQKDLHIRVNLLEDILRELVGSKSLLVPAGVNYHVPTNIKLGKQRYDFFFSPASTLFAFLIFSHSF